MTHDRPKIGFAEELESFDPSSWDPKQAKTSRARPPKEHSTSLAEASGFRSREAVPTSQPNSQQNKPTRQRRRRTGRNTQFNIKADPAVIDRFAQIADAQGWVFGEALERAVELMEEHYKTR